MKTWKHVIFCLLLIGGFSLVEAQRTTVRVYPKRGTVVTTVSKPKVIIHRNTNYYFADGVWYTRLGTKYKVVKAPTGVKIRRLPRARKVVIVNNQKRYRYRGVWYKKSGRFFVVVNT